MVPYPRRPGQRDSRRQGPVTVRITRSGVRDRSRCAGCVAGAHRALSATCLAAATCTA